LPAVAINVAELAPAGTVTDDGTVSRVLLSDKATAVFAEAIWLTPTVHVVDAPEVTDPGLQLIEVTVSGTTTVMVPPVPLIDIGAPEGAAAITLVMPIVADDAVEATVAVTVAIVLLDIRLASKPVEVIPVRKQL